MEVCHFAAWGLRKEGSGVIANESSGFRVTGCAFTSSLRGWRPREDIDCAFVDWDAMMLLRVMARAQDPRLHHATWLIVPEPTRGGEIRDDGSRRTTPHHYDGVCVHVFRYSDDSRGIATSFRADQMRCQAATTAA